MRKARNGHRVTIRQIGPEEAEEILGRSGSVKVRQIRKSRVEMYAKEMSDGKWVLHGQGITLDMDGRLLDGHHRMEAVVLSGCEAPFVVTTGCQEGDVMKIDEGQKRRLSDFLAAEGWKNCSALAATLRVIYDYRNGQLGVPFFSGKVMTIPEGIKLANSCGQSLADAVSRIHGTMLRGVGPHGYQAFIVYEAWKNNMHPLVDDWLNGIQSGVGLDEKDPRNRVRESYIKHLKLAKKPSNRVRTALYTKAWNKWVQGEECSLLIWRSVGRVKEPFPTPIFGEEWSPPENGEAV